GLSFHRFCGWRLTRSSDRRGRVAEYASLFRPTSRALQGARSSATFARQKSMHRDKLGRFARGHCGNMTGRPRGSRNKLGEVFITQLYTDWLEHGEAGMAAVRTQKPDAYLKVVASLPEAVGNQGSDLRWTYRRATRRSHRLRPKCSRPSSRRS